MCTLPIFTKFTLYTDFVRFFNVGKASFITSQQSVIVQVNMGSVWSHLSVRLLVVIFTQVFLPRFWRRWWYWNTAEERLLALVKKTAKRGDAASVLAAVEKYNEEYEWTIMLERDKRVKVEEVVREASPKVCFEMGCYCGLSAIAVGRQLSPGSRLVTVEMNPKIAEIAREIIIILLLLFAGLDQVITVVTGKAEDVIRLLPSQYSVEKLDFVFIDHFKWLYLPDLKLLEETRLLRKGTVLMADNTLAPGAPDFLEYVETCGRYKTERFYTTVPLFNIQDAVTISVYYGDGSEDHKKYINLL